MKKVQQSRLGEELMGELDRKLPFFIRLVFDWSLVGFFQGVQRRVRAFAWNDPRERKSGPFSSFY